MHLRLLAEPDLQLGQRQVGLLFQPLAKQSLFGGADFGLASWPVSRPSHAPGARIGRRYFFGPPQTDAKIGRQILQRAVSLFVGRKEIAAIILL